MKKLAAALLTAMAAVAPVAIAPVADADICAGAHGRHFAAGGCTNVVGDVAVGADTDFGTTTWRVDGADRIRWSSDPGVERELPVGTDLVVVRMTVIPHAIVDWASEGCTLMLDEADGDRSARTWEPASSSYLDLDFDDPTTTGCDSTRLGRYEAAVGFLVPVDAGEDADLRLAVQTVDQLPRYLRVTL